MSNLLNVGIFRINKSNFKKNLPFSTFYDIILQVPVKWRNGKIDLSNDDDGN